MDMTTDGVRLLTIGEFSRLSRISIRMLRHYDERGLLPPAAVDPRTGYRSYSHHQFRTAERIRALRDVGCPIAEIGPLVAQDDPEALRAGLERQRERLLADERDVQARLAGVARLIDELKEPTMSIDIRRTTVPAMTVAALRDVIPTYGDEGRLWERFMPAASAAGVAFAEPPTIGATFHDEDYQERDVDVEIWASVAAPFAPSGDLRCVDVPAREVVSATLRGSYEGVGAVSAALGAWVAEHGAAVTGPMFDVYVVGPGQEPDPQRWVTEICLPVAAG